MLQPTCMLLHNTCNKFLKTNYSENINLLSKDPLMLLNYLDTYYV